MPSTILLESVVILAVFFAFTVFAPVLCNISRFIGSQLLDCPFLDRAGRVWVNPFGAAFTTAYGEPRLRVRECSL